MFLQLLECLTGPVFGCVRGRSSVQAGVKGAREAEAGVEGYGDNKQEKTNSNEKYEIVLHTLILMHGKAGGGRRGHERVRCLLGSSVELDEVFTNPPAIIQIGGGEEMR